MCINQTHMNFLELFLTLIHIKMRPTTTNDTNEHVHRNIWGYTSQSACTHTSAPTHTHSIPVGGVRAGDLIDCEVHKFQNSKVKHPPFKEKSWIILQEFPFEGATHLTMRSLHTTA